MNFAKAIATAGMFALAFGCLVAQPAEAKIVIDPNEAVAGQDQLFSVRVTDERNVGTVGIKILVPPGVSKIAPRTKTGWRMEVIGPSATEPEAIVWSGNEIAPGDSAVFAFDAKPSENVETLPWRSYQIYGDAEVGSWDISPAIGLANVGSNPPIGQYSETKVVEDGGFFSTKSIALMASIFALAVAALGLIIVEHTENPKVKPTRSRRKRAGT